MIALLQNRKGILHLLAYNFMISSHNISYWPVLRGFMQQLSSYCRANGGMYYC